MKRSANTSVEPRALPFKIERQLHFVIGGQPSVGKVSVGGVLWADELGTLDSGLWTSDSGLWTRDFGLWTRDPGLGTRDSGP